MKNIIIIGPPGSGKDTQIEELYKCFEFEKIAGGDVARALGAKNKELKDIIEHGGLINDDVVLKEVDTIISKLDKDKGIIFDGFPRDLYQAEHLDKILISHSRTLDAVLYIDLSEEEVVSRLSSRRVCSLCSQNIPNGVLKCTKCGGRPVRRPDDEPAIIINRMQVFLEKSLPLISFYRNRGILVEIDGNRPIVDIAADIKERLILCPLKN